MQHDTPHILLVNPWIHDFAAYDFWAKPLGLLILTSILRDHGYQVSYIDCLDRFHPKASKKNPNLRHGCGAYLKKSISKPKGLEDVSRTFSRYGIREKWFKEDLVSLKKPDLILVTSHMTYWHYGVRDTIAVIKRHYPDIPVILGGIYASLCHEHATRFSGADVVISGPSEDSILKIAAQHTGFSATPLSESCDLDTYPYPAFDLQNKISYVPLLTSRGCPFSCAYCASSFLEKRHRQRTPALVVEEIMYWHKKYNIKDFSIYDDAFLVNGDNHAIPILEQIINANLDICFHTPNALHIREISKHTATLLYKAGFKTLRLGLETLTFSNREKLDSKVTAKEFQRAVAHLKDAGFHRNMIGAYLLTGLPGQEIESVKQSIRIVKQSGITPILAYYTPIPHTHMWEGAKASSRYNLDSDPIFTNNAIFPCQKEPFSWNYISDLKKLIKK